MTETYYSIRIGIPRRHSPYLMLSDDQKTPLMFATRKEAEDGLAARLGRNRKVVRVRIKFSPAGGQGDDPTWILRRMNSFDPTFVRNRIEHALWLLTQACGDTKMVWDTRNQIERTMIELGKVLKGLPPRSTTGASTGMPSLGASVVAKCWRCETLLLNLRRRRGRPGPSGGKMTGWCPVCAERVTAKMNP